jgi:(6-4)DNA photolyase
MSASQLILVLGDQLSLGRGALRGSDPARDVVLMAEVAEEAQYVPHNRHKLAFIFSAMRHFRQALEAAGYRVIYRQLDEGVHSLAPALEEALQTGDFNQLRICESGEYRLNQHLKRWMESAEVSVDWVEDDRFLCSHSRFAAWADGRKTLRMEYFYRDMRKRYGILLDIDGKPEGGRWNYDAENRSGWRAADTPPSRPLAAPDQITKDVLAMVECRFPDNPGDLSQYYLGATAEDAQSALSYFLDQGLPLFGKYQDAMASGSPWLFHSLISMYLNVGLLDPLEVCLAVENQWRKGQCDLASAEGFIRQVLGWREYVRGIYWLHMPDYGNSNGLAAKRPLPDWFWSAETDMHCLQEAIGQSLDLGYAHHIQRLMVIGNFALLTGLDVRAVCEWYLSVYVDAFEWVELPNTLGMALHGDGGIMASKPYAASGKYIQRQGDYCKHCVYKPNKMTGEGACPFNSLYWAFLDRHSDQFTANPRMALAMRNWERKSSADRQSILSWAERETVRVLEPQAT